MQNETERPLILSALMDDHAQQFFNEQRRRFFPPERNYLDAHLTLFHKLPADHVKDITAHLHKTASTTHRLPARASDIMFMGFGSAYHIECPALITLRQSLAGLWQNWLGPQDKQKFKPHITFQNKVAADLAKKTYADQRAAFTPFDFQIMGFGLWYYNFGPWQPIDRFLFEPC